MKNGQKLDLVYLARRIEINSNQSGVLCCYQYTRSGAQRWLFSLSMFCRDLHETFFLMFFELLLLLLHFYTRVRWLADYMRKHIRISKQFSISTINLNNPCSSLKLNGIPAHSQRILHKLPSSERFFSRNRFDQISCNSFCSNTLFVDV